MAEAADHLVVACTEHPDSDRLAINASALLFADGRPGEAAELLKSRIADGSTEADILVNCGRALLAQAPSSREQASQAFDLFAQAYALCPKPEIARDAWKAARGAGRLQEGGKFFAEMKEGAPRMRVRTADDLIEVMQTAKQGLVEVDGGLDALVELKRLDQERSDFLNVLCSAHALAYTDFLRLVGRPWEHWTGWTQQFVRQRSEDLGSPSNFSVLADWPSSLSAYNRRHGADQNDLLADPTAILTLGVLGPDTAQQILGALKVLYVQAGTLEELRKEVTRIGQDILIGRASPYIETERFLRQMPCATIPYSEELESVAPDDPAIGASRVDIGAAILHDALYVTDISNSKDRPDEAKPTRIPSAALLAALNASGAVSANRARLAAEAYPGTFEGWETEPFPTLTDTIVFNPFALLDWVGAGLADVLGDRVKVGPWAWMHIAGEAERRKIQALAHERLQGTLEVLRKARDYGSVVEIEAEAGDQGYVDTEALTDDNGPAIEVLWQGGLRSLRTAKARGLQLWADDRFYPLLLTLGGPERIGFDIKTVRDPLVAWADRTPPVCTMELLDRLCRSKHMERRVAQNAATVLFTQGYRMAHPILLTHALSQFPVPVSDPLTRPFQKLVEAIEEIPDYVTEIFELIHSNSDVSVREASIGVALGFIVAAWEAEGLDHDRRCILADTFLNAVEHVIENASPERGTPRYDRESLICWPRMVSALLTMPYSDGDDLERHLAGLRWLGDAAASRTKHRKVIVRLLEDSMLSRLEAGIKAPSEVNQRVRQSEILIGVLVPSSAPLIDSGLVEIHDRLLRRTVGMLTGLRGVAHVYTTNKTSPDGDPLKLKVSEEDIENAAADVLRGMSTGQLTVELLFYVTDIRFPYTCQAPTEWINAGFPTEKRIVIDVRCSLFALLWIDPPGLRSIINRLIVSQLSVIDPNLTYRILALEDTLLSDNPEQAREARTKLAIDVLQSGYFDLQRDLAHAIWRFRHYNIEDFARFVGWVGEETAQALANHPLTGQIAHIGPVVMPVEHLLGLMLLSDSFDDGPQMLDRARQMQNKGDEADQSNANPASLTEWLASQASLAETANCPFVAAWALRSVLLVLSEMDQNPELHIGGRVLKASDWCAGYLAAALDVEKTQPTDFVRFMVARRRLASATLLLAAFACMGAKHVLAYKKEDDPLGVWLQRVWLLASKLQIATVGLEGGLDSAVAKATAAVHDLDLASPSDRVADAFDPYAFGLKGDDIGTALTLTAMLKAIRQQHEANLHPVWLTDTVRGLVQGLVHEASDTAGTNDDGIGNRFGFAAPLRVCTIAHKLLARIAHQALESP